MREKGWLLKVLHRPWPAITGHCRPLAPTLRSQPFSRLLTFFGVNLFLENARKRLTPKNGKMREKGWLLRAVSISGHEQPPLGVNLLLAFCHFQRSTFFYKTREKWWLLKVSYRPWPAMTGHYRPLAHTLRSQLFSCYCHKNPPLGVNFFSHSAIFRSQPFSVKCEKKVDS